MEYPKVFTLVAFLIFFGCKNKTNTHKPELSEKAANCNPYFIYDHVEHYYFAISEGEELELETKKKKTNKENNLIELLIQDSPYKLSDTTILYNIEKIGYVKKELPNSKFDKLNQIFCERKHKKASYTTCIAIYRDILIFKKSNRIVGTAKICFECGQNVIAGSTRNTDEFGQSGDYGELYNILH